MSSDSNLQVTDPLMLRLRASFPWLGGSRLLRSAASWFGSAAVAIAMGAATTFGASLTLTWNDNSTNESGFKIERSSAGSGFTQIAVTGANVATYADSALADNTSYTYRVRAYNEAGDSAYTSEVTATTAATANSAPTISDVASLSISANTSTGALAFSVGDAETPAGSLAVTATSSNTTLVPQGNLALGGSGSARTVSVTPAANQSGSAVITLTVSDGTLTASDTFTVTVAVQNTAPTISDITNRVITANTTTGTISFTVGDVQTAAGSLSVTANSSNLTLVPDANVTVGGSGANRTIAVSPAFGQSGVATITVTVSDGSLSSSDSFVLTVNEVNTAPTISDITNRSVNANTSTGAIAFSIGDAQTSASSLTVTSSSTNVLLVPTSNIVLGGSGSSRTVSITPGFNQSGTATITITVSDGVLTASDSFVLTVNTVNTPPTITDITNRTIDANSTTGALSFTIGDAQTAPAALSVSGTSSNVGLVPLSSIVFGGSDANRTVMIVPAQNQAGSATITITVSDGLASVSDTFVVIVNPLNTAPSVTAIASRTIDANTGTGALAFTIGDAETPLSSVVVTATSSNTSLVPNQNIVLAGTGAGRSLSVTPTANQTGVATITLAVSDGSLTTTTTFTLTVDAISTAPTISAIANSVIEVNTTTGQIPFTIGHATKQASALTVTATSSNLTLVPLSAIVLEGSDANRKVTVSPAAQKTGSSTITIVVSDGTLSTSEGFLVTVNAVNTAPTISTISDRSVRSNNTTGAIAFSVDDSTTPVGSLIVSATSSNLTLLPIANISFGGSGANRTIVLTPTTGQSGNATVTVTVSDGQLSASTTFGVFVQAASSAPTIADLPNRTIAKNASTGVLAVAVADQDTALSSLTLSAHSSNLSLLPLSGIALGGSGGNRTVSLTPAANQTGSATVTLTVTDGTSSTSTSFVLTVTSDNTSPTIGALGNRSVGAGSSTGAMDFTVADAETAAGSLLVTVTSSNPSLVPPSSLQLGGAGGLRTLTVTPSANLTGTATITVTVSDGTASDSSSFVLTVTGATTAPTVSTLTNRTISMDGSTGSMTLTVGDAQTTPFALTLAGNSSNTALVPVANIVFGGSGAGRTVTVTPARGQTGSATITISVNNGTQTTSTSFVLTVTAPNTAPTITSIGAQTLEMNLTSGAVDFIIGDAQTAASDLTVSASSSNLAVISQAGFSFSGLGANRAVTLTPVSDKTGSTTITLTVSDGAFNTTSSFVVTVNPKNTPPTITSITNRSIAASTKSAIMEFFVGDALTPAANLVVTGKSSNPALIPQSGIELGGSGANRWLTAKPTDGQTGTSTITISVSDGTLVTSTSFVLSVDVPNTAPTISPLTNRSTVSNRNSGAIEFVVGDAETAVGSLTVSGTSSNPALLPQANIVFGGSGENRTVTLTPTANQIGSVTVTLTVHDGSLAASTSFVLTVTVSSTAPKISDIPNRSITVNGNAGVSFTISDAETAAGSLTVTATSQNTVLVPTANILIGGTGGNRTALITPASDRTGTAVITITVSDGTLTSSASFSLIVSAAGSSPTISRISNRSIDANTSTGPISFLVSDSDTPVANIVMTGSSSNPSLVPSANIVFGGSGNNRTVSITPAANQSGTAMITLTATDGKNSTSYNFYLTVYAVNAPPTISGLANRSIVANGGPEYIGFTVADPDSAASTLVVTARSSNQALLPDSSIVIAGSGGSRTILVSPSTNQIGITTVTVTVSDGNLSTNGTFVLTVGASGSDANPSDGSSGGSGENPPTPPLEQPNQVAVTISRQPQSKSIPLASSTTLDVEIVAGVTASYQWYVGARGDTSTPVSGANSPVLVTPFLISTTTYWVRVWSTTSSASSQEAIVSVAADNRYYFGSVVSGSSITGASGTQAAANGGFGLLVRSNNTGVFLADSPTLSRGVVSIDFVLSPSGTFSFDAPGVGLVTGLVTGTSVTGNLGGTGLTFSGTEEANNGSTANVAGIYSGALINTSDNEIVALAGSSGRAYVAVSQDGIFRGKDANLSADGVIVATLPDGRTVGLDTEGGRLYGTVTVGEKILDVGGKIEGLATTTKVNNLSVLARAGQGSESLIAGFTISGTGTKKVVIRAIGPALAAFGVTNALVDPVVTIRRQGIAAESSLVGSNDNWVESEGTQAFLAVGAFPLVAGSKDAAVVLNLPAGGYSAQITAADGSAGLALVEIYDADDGASSTKLANISLRGTAGTGSNVIITGFNVSGDVPRRMLVRVVGPELDEFGVNGTLKNPKLTIYKTSQGQTTEVASNDDWGTDADSISKLNTQVGAFPLAPGSKSAALGVWLAPGTYTAHATSGDDSSGVVIVEVYEAP